MKNLILAASFFAALTAFAHEEDPNAVAIAKATELGVHRIERLVILKKIDPMFADSLAIMRAERTGDSTQPYRVEAEALPDAHGKSSRVQMLSDSAGKVLSYTVSETFVPAAPVAWPILDAATLMEEGLHFVLDGWVTHPEVKPFFLGLTSISMRAGTDEAGHLIALFEVTSDDDPRVLHIALNADGSFRNYELK